MVWPITISGVVVYSLVLANANGFNPNIVSHHLFNMVNHSPVINTRNGDTPSQSTGWSILVIISPGPGDQCLSRLSGMMMCHLHSRSMGGVVIRSHSPFDRLAHIWGASVRLDACTIGWYQAIFAWWAQRRAVCSDLQFTIVINVVTIMCQLVINGWKFTGSPGVIISINMIRLDNLNI